ncbi:cobalamin biosynthesis protein CobQ [Vibrio parahaemolyticus]|nr:cobalamin biosynthesis protein CobQ [Vibrio parahaemolyticus]EJC6922228.1 cobalamin biosynthesis protein CobQ [Vibrio parahaemolyticus]EKL0053133.1 cobalamin biosynthesis protein CobQ [Vibrio parahaemolyticus]EMD9682508.1 cobalamin biosynthesis protein CobQ [Vibrio parahaemolyticus]HBC3492403.1 cobalamin biosynthesis protein CobQ [Vibrio alginolyticus]
MSEPSIEFFPVANGDMTLITTKNEKRILIDCNYRQPSDEVVDVKEMLRDRLKRNEDEQLFIDVFIVTHPDQDHTRGFREIFHTGAIADWKKNDDKIIINEMWSSPRVFRRASRKPKEGESANNTLTDDAIAINTEAKRRATLYKDSLKIGELGDRLVILTEDEDNKTEGMEGIVADLYSEFVGSKSGIDDNSIEAYLLGPADKQEVEEDEENLSKNDSSAIIQFQLVDDENYTNYFLNGGDAGVKCWELLYKKMNEADSKDRLQYDVLQAPHHCSWRSLSEDSESDCESPQVNEDAKNALGQALNNAIIVSSSRPFGKETPPSRLAEEEYRDILDGQDGDFIMVSDQTDKDGNETSLYVTFTNGKPKLEDTPVNFAKTTAPAAVQKKGKNTYA